MRKFTAILIVFLFCFVSSLSLALTQDAPGRGLFMTVDATESRSVPPIPQQIGTERTRLVQINTSALALADASRGLGRVPDDPGILLNLFDDQAFLAINETITARPSGKSGYVWTGILANDPYSTVILVIDGSGVTGRVMQTSKTYYISPLVNGLHVVSQINPAIGHAEFEGDAVIAPRIQPVPPAPNAPQFSDTGDIIDVMVVYTPAAETYFGGVTATEAAVDEMVTLTNTSYANSSVNQRIRLVHVGTIAYVEQPQPDYLADLNNITRMSDGYMDDVHALRDEYKADLVMLLTATHPDKRNYCGIAWLLTGSAQQGFSVSESACAATVVMPHELGHNMGSMHDVANGGSGGGGWSAYSYGYQDRREGYDDWGDFVTIMAYSRNGQCPQDNPLNDVGEGEICPYILRWSSPNQEYEDKVLGNETTDNVRSLNETAFIVANFRVSDNAIPESFELLQDGGFEAELTDHWKLKNTSRKDKIKCNKDDAVTPKVFAYSGECALRIKGEPGESSTIQQKPDVSALVPGNTLMLRAWVSAKNLASGAKFRVRVKYEDTSLAKGKLNLAIEPGTYDYVQLESNLLEVTGTVQKLKVQVRYRKPAKATGRLLIDDVSLLAYETVSSGLIPLPPAP